MSLLKYRHWQYWLLLSLLRALWCLHHYIEHMIFYFYDSKSKLSAICHKIKQIQGISSNFSLAKFISFSEIIFYYILFCSEFIRFIIFYILQINEFFIKKWLYGISGGKLNYFPLVNIHHLSWKHIQTLCAYLPLLCENKRYNIHLFRRHHQILNP